MSLLQYIRFGMTPISSDVGTSHKVMHGLTASGAPYFLKQSRELTIKNGELLDAI